MTEATPSHSKIVSADVRRGAPADRTPPGQTLTAKWPVLHYGNVPKIDPYAPGWKLRVFGLCDDPYDLSYRDIRELPAIDVICDIHCVTHWSRLDNTFIGVPTKLLIERAKPRAEVK